MLSGVEFLGWVGGGLGAVAYVMVSTKRVAADTVLFQGMNMIGAALLCVGAFHSGALPNAVMNLAWIGFGAHALLSAQRRQLNVAPDPERREVDPDGVRLAA